MPSCILVVYVLLYFLLPKFLQHHNYWGFILGFALLCLSVVIIDFFISKLFYRLTCNCQSTSLAFSQVFGMGFLNAANALTIGGLALGIKLVKGWVIRHEENQKLIRQKILIELKLQKSRIYPGFVIKSLDNLYTGIITNSPGSPEMVLRLAELLSYLLYESNEEWIPVQHELEMLRNLLTIEQVNQGDHLIIQCQISGDHNNQYVKPLILFPLLQNCFESIDNNKGNKFRCYLETRVENQTLSLRLEVEQLDHQSSNIEWHKILEDLRNRLNISNHESCRLDFEKIGVLNTARINLSLVKPFPIPL